MNKLSKAIGFIKILSFWGFSFANNEFTAFAEAENTSEKGIHEYNITDGATEYVALYDDEQKAVEIRTKKGRLFKKLNISDIVDEKETSKVLNKKEYAEQNKIKYTTAKKTILSNGERRIVERDEELGYNIVKDDNMNEWDSLGSINDQKDLINFCKALGGDAKTELRVGENEDEEETVYSGNAINIVVKLLKNFGIDEKEAYSLLNVKENIEVETLKSAKGKLLSKSVINKVDTLKRNMNIAADKDKEYGLYVDDICQQEVEELADAQLKLLNLLDDNNINYFCEVNNITDINILKRLYCEAGDIINRRNQEYNYNTAENINEEGIFNESLSIFDNKDLDKVYTLGTYIEQKLQSIIADDEEMEKRHQIDMQRISGNGQKQQNARRIENEKYAAEKIKIESRFEQLEKYCDEMSNIKKYYEQEKSVNTIATKLFSDLVVKRIMNIEDIDMKIMYIKNVMEKIRTEDSCINVSSLLDSISDNQCDEFVVDIIAEFENINLGEIEAEEEVVI